MQSSGSAKLMKEHHRSTEERTGRRRKLGGSSIRRDKNEVCLFCDIDRSALWIAVVVFRPLWIFVRQG